MPVSKTGKYDYGPFMHISSLDGNWLQDVQSLPKPLSLNRSWNSQRCTLVSKIQSWLLKQQWVTKPGFWALGSDHPTKVSAWTVRHCLPCMATATVTHVATTKRPAELFCSIAENTSMLSFICASEGNLFIQQILIEHLLSARHHYNTSRQTEVLMANKAKFLFSWNLHF